MLHNAALDPIKHLQRDTNGAELPFQLAGILVVAAEIFASRRWWVRRYPLVAHRLRRDIREGSGAFVVLGGLLITLALALLGFFGLWGTVLLFGLAAAAWLVLVMVYTAPVTEEPSQSLSENEAPIHPASFPQSLENGGDEGAASSAPTKDGGEDSEGTGLAPQASTARTKDGGEGSEGGFWEWFQAHAIRLMLVPVALLCSAAAFSANVARDPAGRVVDVVLTTGGFLAWMLSIVLWSAAFGFDWKQARTWPQEIRRLPRRAVARARRIETIWTAAALIGIVVLGAYFRLHDLGSTPPEMTSDHIEKLLDALRVSDGYRGIFFPNNGGREGFQMYFVSFLANVFGLGFRFDTLKMATVIEGLITLPALWWMARQIFGSDREQDRQIGNWVGLALAGLVAISSWHVMLSRLGLRIVLTSLTTALVIGFLARAMRHNRTADYIALGIVLGAGTYFYQANRMLPILVVIGILLAAAAQIAGRIRSGRDLRNTLLIGTGFAALAAAPVLAYIALGRALDSAGYGDPGEIGERLDMFLPMAVMVWFALLSLFVRASKSNVILQYGSGLMITIILTLALYIPMYHYSKLYPEYFWNRTRGRMFGENAFVRQENGAMVAYEPSLKEQWNRFWDKRDIFVQNYRDDLRMYHWEGDKAWINNAEAHPALDPAAGGLLILGVVLWGVRLARRHDPVDWLLPFAVLVMLLPTAMTLAYTVENPSFTRASGTIPPVFLLAALPLGLLLYWVARLPLRVRSVPLVGLILALLLLFGLLWEAKKPDWDNFFTDYRLTYSNSWRPYSEIARPLHDFAHGEGSYGNAFMVAYPYWLDHRILGTMAGDIRWPNGLVSVADVQTRIALNQGTRYQLDPTRPLFFMYNVADSEAPVYLEENFPGGETRVYNYSYETPTGEATGSFTIYEVSP